MFVVQRLSSNSLNSTYKGNPNTRDSFQITDYCLRLGSEQIPPSRFRALETDHYEPFEALKVAFHCGGNTLNCMGILAGTTYAKTAKLI